MFKILVTEGVCEISQIFDIGFSCTNGSNVIKNGLRLKYLDATRIYGDYSTLK